jgi:SpoIIAA-like
MIEIVEGLPKNVVGFAVSGRLTMDDCQEVLVPAVKQSLKRHDKIRLYYELNSRFPGASWDDLDLGLEHFANCERVAIVTDIGWVRLTVKALRFLIPSEIRVFSTLEIEEGRDWIRSRRATPTEGDGAEEQRRPTRRVSARRIRRVHPANARRGVKPERRAPQPSTPMLRGSVNDNSGKEMISVSPVSSGAM